MWPACSRFWRHRRSSTRTRRALRRTGAARCPCSSTRLGRAPMSSSSGAAWLPQLPRAARTASNGASGSVSLFRQAPRPYLVPLFPQEREAFEEVAYDRTKPPQMRVHAALVMLLIDTNFGDDDGDDMQSEDHLLR